MKKNLFVVLVLSGIFFFCSCEENDALISVNDDNIFETDVEKNSPRISKENGNFAYILHGNSFVGTSNESVNFKSENVTVTINLENFKAGKCKILIKSDYTNELFEKEITGNLIYSEDLQFDDYPEQVIIEVNGFSGKLKFALTETE